MSNEMNLPWEVCHNSWEVSTIYDCNEYPVCSIRIDPDVTEHTQDILERAKEERAAHIVKCVNAHEDLVEALQSISEYWNGNRNDTAMHDACVALPYLAN